MHRCATNDDRCRPERDGRRDGLANSSRERLQGPRRAWIASRNTFSSVFGV